MADLMDRHATQVAEEESDNPERDVADLMNRHDATRDPDGPTYRQLDHWTRCGRLRAESGGGYGRPRRWDASEIEVARTVARLVRAGLVNLDAAFTVARGQSQIAPGVRVIIENPS